MDKVIDFINLNRDRYLNELKALLAIPSISALPEHATDVRRCAEWCAAEMRRIGLENVRLIETPGNPVVYGDWLKAPGAPAILFYGHYDVQPPDPLELWESDPFTLEERDGWLYGRGVADDKGQLYVLVKAAAELAAAGELPVNVRVACDGASGIEEARSFRPQVVLCDIGLPGGFDGYAVARAFRQHADLRHACLVALTGYGQAEDQQRSREAGFDRHLNKPVHFEAIQKLIVELPEIRSAGA